MAREDPAGARVLVGGWVAAKAVPARPSNGPGKLLRGSAVWTQGDKGREPAEGLGQGEPPVNRVYCGVGTQGPRCGPTLLLVLAQDRGTTAEGRTPWASRHLPTGPIWGLPRAGRELSPSRRVGLAGGLHSCPNVL